MATQNVRNGSLYLVKIDDKNLACQLDANISFTQEMDTEDPCKPAYTDGKTVSWVHDSAGRKSWEISGSGKVTEDDTETMFTADALAKHFIESNDAIEVSVGNVDINKARGITYSGTAQLTSFTLNYPATGGATYDYTATGLGAVTQTITPIEP